MGVPGLAELLDEVGRAAGGDAVLWRGPDLTGRDVDLVVTPRVIVAVGEVLLAAGLDPRPGDPGHVTWVDRSKTLPELDVLQASAWPAAYPALDGVLARAGTEPGVPLPVAAAEDRALVFLAEAVAGRPVEKSLARAQRLLAEPGVAERARAVAAAEGADELLTWGIAADPAAFSRRGRVTYPRALGVARASAPARDALRRRAGARLGRAGRRLVPRRSARRPLLIALSGMDGAGKSTLAEAIRSHLEAEGHPAEYTWARLGSEGALLDRLAMPVKRLLRRQGTVGDPVAAGGPEVEKVRDPREAQGRRRVTSWVWILIVATLNARTYRRAAAGRHTGASVVCDRWLVDALVDLELRYGRHAAAERALRLLVPKPDLGILLVLDAETAERRKPGDQARYALEHAERLYDAKARDAGLLRVSAMQPPAAVRAEALALVRDLL